MSPKKQPVASNVQELSLQEEILGRIAEAVFVIDQQGNILYANRAAYEGRGYTKSEIIKLNIKDINLPERAGFVKERVNEVTQKGRATFETIHVRKDGSTFPVEITSRMIKHSGIAGMIAVARDVSERKQAEDALREKDRMENFKLIAENANDGIVVLSGADGTVAYSNRQISKMVGYTARELSSMGIKDLGHPSEYKRVRERYQKRLAGQKVPATYEATIITKSGKSLMFELTAAKTKWHGQSADVVFFRDVSERKKVEDLQREKRIIENFKSLVGNANDGVTVTLGTGEFVYANNSIARMTGYTTSELTSLHFKKLVHPRDAARVQKTLKKRIAGQSAQRTYEVTLVKKSGEPLPVEVTGARTIWQGEPASVVTYRDISERIATAAKTESDFLLLQGIMNSTDGPVFSLDAKGRYTSFNQGHIVAMKQSYGANIEIGEKVFDYVTDKTERDHAKDCFRRVMKGESFSEETHYGTDESGKIYFDITYSPIYDRNMKVVGGSVFARNISEKLKADKALRESEERYRSIFENTTVAVIRTQVDGSISSGNPAFARMLGYDSVDELIEAVSNVRDLYINPQQRDRLIAILNAEGVANDFPIELKRRDGSVCSISVNVRAIKDSSGNTVALEGLLVDITARKRAEEQLKEAHDKLEATLRAIPDLMLEVDVKGRIYDYHAPADELLYVPSEAFIGKSVEEILPKEAADICLKAIERAAQKGWFRGSTYSLDLPRGTRWFEMSIDVKSRVEGKANRLLIISRDITDRMLAEETIKRERDSAQMYLDVVNTIVVAVNKKGHVLMINKYGAKLLGYPEEEIVGKPWFETFIPYHERKLVKKVHADIVAGKLEGIKKFENMVICRDGEERLISWHNEYVTNPKGEFLFTLSAGEDITEMQAARYELKENYGRLEEVIGGIIKALAATVETRDPYTAGHQRRVAQLAVAISEKLGWKKNEVNGLEMAATIHDIGKMYVPAEVLNKPGKLEPIEFELIKMHSAAGYEIVKDIAFEEPIADMVRQHHERLNGSGYPDGLRSKDILPGAKVMAVADVVEAMSSNRPYRAGAGLNAALQEVESRKGDLYDPEVVEVCVELFAKNKFRFD